MKVNECRVCQSQRLDLVLDLGRTALANRFLRPEQLGEPEPTFPLRIILCGDCGLVQLDEEVPREILFKEYLYASGTSSLVRKHARWLGASLGRRYSLGAQDLVMEAASNDGTVLKEFRWQGMPVLGIEPAKNIAAGAIVRGIPTIVDFFDDRLARALREQYGPARLFLARHADSMSKEIGHRACHSCRCLRETLVRSGLLEMEIGSRWALRAATCPMSQPRPWMPTLCWLASRQVAASAARFTVPVTEVTRGRRFQLWTASVSSISSLHPRPITPPT